MKSDSSAGSLAMAEGFLYASDRVVDLEHKFACVCKIPHLCDSVESCKPPYKLSTIFF